MKHSTEYEKYIRSETWAKKKLERLEIDNYCCAMCGKPESACKNGLQLHHISYKNLGREDVWTETVCLCGRCHKLIHKYYDRRQRP